MNSDRVVPLTVTTVSMSAIYQQVVDHTNYMSEMFIMSALARLISAHFRRGNSDRFMASVFDEPN